MNWDEVRRWRVGQRRELVAQRALSRAQKRIVRDLIADEVREYLSVSAGTVIGGYWPIRGEVDLTQLFREFEVAGCVISLPVITQKKQPVEFWRWSSDMPMKLGCWNIPVPAERQAVVPDILLVPLVGFDDEFFRLGNGGGYYDRTLEAMTQKPLSIGIGYEFSRMPTIFPQAHDVPMDVIITEDGVRERLARMPSRDLGVNEPVQMTSAPCFMAETDPAYFGFMSGTECLDLLVALLRDIRAAAGAAMEIMLFGGNALGTKMCLDLVYGDIHACTILRNAGNGLVTDDGHEIGATFPPFGSNIWDGGSAAELLTLHQQAAEKICRALPRVADLQVYEALTKVLRLQERALKRLTDGSSCTTQGLTETRDAI